ncbi:MAG: hypothetical protein IJW51_08505 [Clostridia bacterium]|nr:hypothetical protein [Clostridia bacterium]
MNRKHENEDLRLEVGQHATHRSRFSLIVAAAVCLLLSLVVWLFVMNAEDTAYVTLEIKGGAAECNYVLSDTALEVGGAISALKQAECIEVLVPEDAVLEGVYVIQLEDLVLPEGLSLTEVPNLTLTVSKK